MVFAYRLVCPHCKLTISSPDANDVYEGAVAHSQQTHSINFMVPKTQVLAYLNKQTRLTVPGHDTTQDHAVVPDPTLTRAEPRSGAVAPVTERDPTMRRQLEQKGRDSESVANAVAELVTTLANLLRARAERRADASRESATSGEESVPGKAARKRKRFAKGRTAQSPPTANVAAAAYKAADSLDRGWAATEVELKQKIEALGNLEQEFASLDVKLPNYQALVASLQTRQRALLAEIQIIQARRGNITNAAATVGHSVVPYNWR